MASSRVVPYLIAGGVGESPPSLPYRSLALILRTLGIAGGIYIFRPSFQDLSGKSAPPTAITEGRSQSHKEDRHNDGTPSTSSPHPPLGDGASPTKHDQPTVAGTSPGGRGGYSADHDADIRANPKEQDGTSGGGQGLAEMRERKMAGQGLPSPQGGDTKAKTTKAQQGYNAN